MWRDLAIVALGSACTLLFPHIFEVLVHTLWKPLKLLKVGDKEIPRIVAGWEGFVKSLPGTIAGILIITVSIIILINTNSQNDVQMKNIDNSPNINIDLKIDTEDLSRLNELQLDAIGQYIDRLREIKK
jgi:hypothetical protein